MTTEKNENLDELTKTELFQKVREHPASKGFRVNQWNKTRMLDFFEVFGKKEDWVKKAGKDTPAEEEEEEEEEIVALGVGSCAICRKSFGFNPLNVPSIDNQPICKECIDKANVIRKSKGLKPVTYGKDAYGPVDARELDAREVD